MHTDKIFMHAGLVISACGISLALEETEITPCRFTGNGLGSIEGRGKKQQNTCSCCRELCGCAVMNHGGGFFQP